MQKAGDVTDETVSEHNEAIPLHLSAVCFGHIITGKKRSGSGSLLHERCCFVSFADQLLEDICRHVHRRQTAYLLIELDRLDPGAYPGACGSLKVGDHLLHERLQGRTVMRFVPDRHPGDNADRR